MTGKSKPVGQLLASLPPDERAQRYRQFATEAVRKAQEACDLDLRAEYVTMAAGWHTMAVEAERLVKEKLPGEDGQPEQTLADPH